MFKVSPQVTPLTQRLPTCCWLTSLEMMFLWKAAKGGAKKNEDQILQAMDASPHLYPYYMRDFGIAPTECKETAKMLGLRWSGDGDFTAEILHEMLKNYGPIWIAGKWYQNYSHVRVITGCEVGSGKVKYLDPLEPSGKESNGTITSLNARGSEWKNCDASVMYWR
jgi:hypothetical protein